MIKSYTNNSLKGVTLIELLVAVAITVVVGGSIVGALFSGRSAFESGDSITFKAENARAALDFIGRDISAAFIFIPSQHSPEFYYGDDIGVSHYESYNELGEPAGPAVTEDTLHLTVLIDSADEEHELRLIRYWLTDDNAILRYEDKLRDPKPTVELLTENVSGLSFEFFSNDSSPGADDKTSYSDWDFYYDNPSLREEHQRGKIPRAVRITVEVVDKTGGNPEEFSTMVHLPMSHKTIDLN